MFPLEDD
nr:co-translated peptide [Expression vector pPK121]